METRPLEGRVALVTGASRGIGRACALELAAAGAQVCVNYHSGKENAAEVVDEICREEGRAICVQGDVASEPDCLALVKATEEALGPVDILVNNAGITRDGLLARMSLEDFDAVIHTNLRSAFILSKAVSRSMMKRRSGVIINISSIIGRRGNAGQVNYAAAKAGLIGLTKSLARELGSRGVRVNAVAPGYIETDMTGGLSAELKERLCRQIPLQVLGCPDDVARSVVFLAGPHAGYITGEVLAVDGGLGM